MYILIFTAHFKMEQGIDGLPGEKADKGAKGESGLNVRNFFIYNCIYINVNLKSMIVQYVGIVKV